MRIVPVGDDVSMEGPLEKVEEALRDCEIEFDVGRIGTTMEADTLAEILEAFECAHDALAEEVPRAVLELTVDARFDGKGERSSKASGEEEPVSGGRRAQRGGQGRERAVKGRSR